MHVIIWRFTPRPGKAEDFERKYAAGGAWDLLFRKAEGFVGTELLRPDDAGGSYLTIDRWRSAAAFAEFMRANGDAYSRLDAECESLTADESRIGTFSSVAPLER